eukprot:PLAT3342.1.p1 GENE.PLAT3342.1~~PLAT3342.1.p1  ORF type:complete len:523 (+),score=47.47 PLAT3342.1:228-1796(+)
MSGAMEGASKEIVPAGGSVALDADASRFQAIPSDVWGVILEFLPSMQSMTLSRTCCRLRNTVLSVLRFAFVRGPLAGFPAARLKSLRRVIIAPRLDLCEAGLLLQQCPQLRYMSLRGSKQVAPDGFLQALPLFPQLEQLKLDQFKLDRRLGKALALCTRLQELKLKMPLGQRRRGGRDEFVADFLEELSACAGLRRLAGIALREEADKRALCAAIGSWERLQDLRVYLWPDREGRRRLPISYDGIACALTAGCPQLRTLCLSGSVTQGQPTAALEDVDAIGRMPSLRRLRLPLIQLPADVFARFGALDQLDELVLDGSSLVGNRWSELSAFVSKQPLMLLRIRTTAMAVEELLNLLRAISEHRSLKSVCLEASAIEAWEPADRHAVAEAFADAICTSPVCKWTTQLPFSLLACVQAWDGRTPTATVKSLTFRRCRSRAIQLDSCFASLLLDFLRSCPSLCTFHVDLGEMSDDVTKSILTSALRSPLSHTTLILDVNEDICAHYYSLSDKLAAAGLKLRLHYG